MSHHHKRPTEEEIEWVLLELARIKHQVHELRETFMIAQSTFDASLTGLTTAVKNASDALAAGSTATSTPDNIVSAFVDGVNAQTAALATATPPPPAPAPTP